MEEVFEKDKIEKVVRVSERVFLKDYSKFDDHRRHRKQSGMITSWNPNSNSLNIGITWDDGDKSYTNIENIIYVKKEWDA